MLEEMIRKRKKLLAHAVDCGSRERKATIKTTNTHHKQIHSRTAVRRVSLAVFWLQRRIYVYILFSNCFFTKVVIMPLSVLIGLQQVCSSAQKIADEQQRSIENIKHKGSTKRMIYEMGG